MQIRWDKVKKAALDQLGRGMPYDTVYARPDAIFTALIAGIGDGSFDWKKNYNELYDRCKRIIERWDVRRAKALIDCFPNVVPAYCRGKVPRAFVADTEDAPWMLEF